MIKSPDNMRKAKVEGPRGGEGIVEFTYILETEEMADSCTMFARLYLHPGASVGEHSHTEDAEVYYILTGTLEADDNGTIKTVGPGDVIYTGDGAYHSIRNVGEQTAEMLAVILT